MRHLIGIAALLLASSVGAAAENNTAEPLRVGAVLALSGPAQAWGQAAREGIELAVEDLNREATTAGTPHVEVQFEDSQTQAAGAVSGFQKLVSIQKSEAVIGDVWDFLTNAMIPLSERAKVPLVSTIVDKATLRAHQYFFTTGQKIDSITASVEKFVARNSTLKRGAIFCWDNDWGYSYNTIWEQSLKAASGDIVGKICLNDFASDWRAEVQKLLPRHPEIVFIGFQTDRIIRRLREQRATPVILTTSNIVEQLADKTFPSEIFDGVYFTDWRPNAQYSAAYEKKFGHRPILESHNSYEALRSIYRAAVANRRELAVGMKQVKYTGVAGRIDFTESNAGNYSNARLFRIEAGEEREVE